MTRPSGQAIGAADDSHALSTEMKLASQEYSTVNETIRHYHNQRFAQLTLWLAVTAAITTVVFNPDSIAGMVPAVLLKMIALLATFCFWLMDERMVQQWRYFWNQAKNLEKRLGFSMWSNRPKNRLAGSTNATRLLYLSVAIFWTVALFQNGGG